MREEERGRTDAGEVRPHLRDLFERHNPGTPIRRLCVEKNVPEHSVSVWFKRTTVTTRLPDHDVLAMLADVIGCPTREVFAAFCEDHGYDYAAYFGDEDALRLLKAFRRMGPGTRELLIRVALIFIADEGKDGL